MGTVKSVVALQVLSLLFVPAISTTDVTPTEDNIDPGAGTSIADLLEKELHNYLSQYDGLSIPSLPTLDIGNEDLYSIALSLNNLTLTGVSNVNVTEFKHQGNHRHPGNQTLRIILPKISLTVGSYISEGHLLNLPFNGEGPMSITIYNLQILITFDWDTFSLLSYLFSCAADNSTNIDLAIRRMEVHFENLNEGTDQGQLVNIVLSSFGPDIMDYLDMLMDTSLYDPLDNALIGLINSKLVCPKNEEIIPLETVVSNVAEDVRELFSVFLKPKVNEV
ncbi:uncharacterized protein LOC121870353 [Homarus americanus]|uniref:Putative hemolymph juvenile hormone binding protein JHBP-like 4 n=1 Tax=Homarus americanus TaxID=6706 RepID=A0A8J5JXT7_HOMAM|nr:uncharacterized protein LOC121870353 [Homarus americanus]KAG7165586.1 putative hemolymph juvenile hormone binding protein JHBP-like 4 [Homarus americanus]